MRGHSAQLRSFPSLTRQVDRLENESPNARFVIGIAMTVVMLCTSAMFAQVAPAVYDLQAIAKQQRLDDEGSGVRQASFQGCSPHGCDFSNSAPMRLRGCQCGSSCAAGQGCMAGSSGGCGADCNMPLATVPPTVNLQANADVDGNCLLSTFRHRTGLRTDTIPITGLETIPTDFSPWWDVHVRNIAGLSQQSMHINVDQLVRGALANAPHIQVAAAQPHIRRTYLVEEAAEFDWRTFLETRYDDLNDPVGNELTVGNGDDRFLQQEWNMTAGLRRKNRIGGEFEISQQLGHLDNNSIFLVPPNQGNARLELTYSQPLLNGQGRAVNESLTVLANIDYRVAGDTFLEEVQEHLLKVTQAYWELYRARAEYAQRLRVLQGGQQILRNLKARKDVDSLSRQVLRAKAAVSTRRSDIARAATSVRNAESQLRLLVNDPSLVNTGGTEFIPADVPPIRMIPVNMSDALATGLSSRPDISQAIRKLRGATLRLGVAKNDLLPQLDLLVSTYVAGLEGDSEIFQAQLNQFQDGRPGFAVGLEFEFPVGNRAARARHERRKWELTRAVNEFRAVVESGLTDVEQATREVTTTYQEMLGRYQAMYASAEETAYLKDRWQVLPDINDSATLLLEDLLDSQDRLVDEESRFVSAQVAYSIALVNLRKSTGTLLKSSGTACQ